LRTFVEINRVLLKKKRARTARLGYPLWELAAGRNSVSVKELIALCVAKQIMSRSAVKKILKLESVFWWPVESDHVFIKSWRHLVSTSDIVDVPIRDFCTVKRFREAIFSTQFPDEDFSNPRSRRNIRACTGIAESTQREYSKNAGISIQPNVLRTGKVNRSRFETPFGSGGYFVRKTDDGLYELCKRLPNSYRRPGWYRCCGVRHGDLATEGHGERVHVFHRSSVQATKKRCWAYFSSVERGVGRWDLVPVTIDEV
jgi:hypothetical protein